MKVMEMHWILLRIVITISPYLLQPDYVGVVVLFCCFCRHRQESLSHPHRCHDSYNHNHYYTHHHLHQHTITNTMNNTSTMKFTKTSGVDKGPQILRRSVLPNFPIIKEVCGFFRTGFRLSDTRLCTERCGSKFANNYGGATSYRFAGAPTNYLRHWQAQRNLSSAPSQQLLQVSAPSNLASPPQSWSQIPSSPLVWYHHQLHNDPFPKLTTSDVQHISPFCDTVLLEYTLCQPSVLLSVLAYQENTEVILR